MAQRANLNYGLTDFSSSFQQSHKENSSSRYHWLASQTERFKEGLDIWVCLYTQHGKCIVKAWPTFYS